MQFGKFFFQFVLNRVFWQGIIYWTIKNNFEAKLKSRVTLTESRYAVILNVVRYCLNTVNIKCKKGKCFNAIKLLKYRIYVNMLLYIDIFPLRGKLKNHRYVFGYNAVEKYLVVFC